MNSPEIEIETTERISRALLEALGENDPYPTPEEIADHKRRAKLRLKHPNLTFSNTFKFTSQRKDSQC